MFQADEQDLVNQKIIIYQEAIYVLEEDRYGTVGQCFSTHYSVTCKIASL